MKEFQTIKKFIMECPLCEKTHEVEERSRMTKTIIKGDLVDYVEKYLYCCNCDDDSNEFASGKIDNENLLNARNSYRKTHNLLTSDEIVSIRERYGLSQVDFSKLLGWGEATISRYESKAIQDELYDDYLKKVRDNALSVFELLQKNGYKLSPDKRKSVKEQVFVNLDEEGREYLQRKNLECDYIHYMEPCDENGNKILDIDKIELIISFFATRINSLYKVKLMKLLWYTDSLYFKKNGVSMTGLVYSHDAFGALPIGHNAIVSLHNVKVSYEEDIDFVKYHFLPNNKLDESNFTEQEIMVLNQVVKRFKYIDSKSIISYMHEEKAYKETKDKEIIPYSLAKEIRTFD